MNDAQAWLHWWTEGYWQQAEESWLTMTFFQQSEPLTTRLQSLDPQLIAGQLRIDARLPPAPHGMTLSLLAMTAEQRNLALRLTAEICCIYSSIDGDPSLDETSLQWCKRISRALRPGLWLPENLTLPWQVTCLLLLRHVLPTGCWQRVRFLFPQPWVSACEAEQGAELAHNKLLPLWGSTLWRSSLPVALASGPARETQDVAA